MLYPSALDRRDRCIDSPGGPTEAVLVVLAFLAVFFHAVGLVSAGHAIMGTRTSQGAIGWAVSLIAFPYLTVPLYWVFGRNKFEGMIEARREHEGEITELIERVTAKVATTKAGKIGRGGRTRRALETLAGNNGFLAGNAVELLVDGPATFGSIIAGIGTAKTYVLVQFYIVRDDGLGNRLADALMKKAAEGVPCYLLYDEIGSFSLSDAWVQRLRDGGVEVSAFHTTKGKRNRFQLNFRNHRKIVVVDGRTAWIGGHNVGDEYLGLDPKLGPWRDTHVKIDGPAAFQAQGSFLEDWFWATRELPELCWDPLPEPPGSTPVIIVSSSPAQRLEIASLVSVELLHAARERIWIATPYFVPDRAVRAALRVAALRGVDVRIVITAKADSLPVHLAAYWYLDALDDVGIVFYRYTEGFMHQKVVLVDDDIGVVGTVNWDSRSFRLNFEVNAIAVDPAFASDVETMLEADFARSEKVSGELESCGFLFRLWVHVARLLSPIL